MADRSNTGRQTPAPAGWRVEGLSDEKKTDDGSPHQKPRLQGWVWVVFGLLLVFNILVSNALLGPARQTNGAAGATTTQPQISMKQRSVV